MPATDDFEEVDDLTCRLMAYREILAEFVPSAGYVAKRERVEGASPLDPDLITAQNLALIACFKAVEAIATADVRRVCRRARRDARSARILPGAARPARRTRARHPEESCES